MIFWFEALVLHAAWICFLSSSTSHRRIRTCVLAPFDPYARSGIAKTTETSLGESNRIEDGGLSRDCVRDFVPGTAATPVCGISSVSTCCHDPMGCTEIASLEENPSSALDSQTSPASAGELCLDTFRAAVPVVSSTFVDYLFSGESSRSCAFSEDAAASKPIGDTCLSRGVADSFKLEFEPPAEVLPVPRGMVLCTQMPKAACIHRDLFTRRQFATRLRSRIETDGLPANLQNHSVVFLRSTA